MNSEPPTPLERVLFAAQVFVLAAIGTAVAALVCAFAGFLDLVDPLATFAQVFLLAGLLACGLYVLLKMCGVR